MCIHALCLYPCVGELYFVVPGRKKEYRRFFCMPPLPFYLAESGEYADFYSPAYANLLELNAFLASFKTFFSYCFASVSASMYNMLVFL